MDLQNIFSYKNIPYIGTALIITIFLGIILYTTIKARKILRHEEEFVKKIEAMSSYSMYKEQKSNDPISTWNRHWGKLLKRSGMASMDQTDASIGGIVLLTAIVIWVVVSVLVRNPVLGIFPSVGILVGIKIAANNKLKSKERLMNDQIPAFLSTLKSNIQANTTPESALIDAINTTVPPLRDELEIAKSYAATTSLSAALLKLRDETSSKDIRFLCSCIELSSKLGANLEDQLETIEKVVEDKMDLQRKLDKAVQENRPLLYVSAAIIPGLFFFTYMMNEATRAFWFREPISWVLLMLIIVIYVGALYITNRFVKRLDEFK